MSNAIREIFRGAAFYTVANLFARALVLLVIPIYTAVLTPHEYGVMGMLDVAVLVGAKLVGLGLYGAQTRRLYDRQGAADPGEEFKAFAFSSNCLVFIGWMLFGASLWTTWPYLQEVLLQRGVELGVEHAWIIFGVVGLLSFKMMAFSYFSAIRDYLKASSMIGLESVAFLVLIYVLLYVFPFGVLGKYMAQGLGALCLMVFFFIPYWRRAMKGARWRKEEARYGIAFGFPIMMHLLCVDIITASDRYVLLGFSVPADEIGAYTLGYQLGMALSVLTHSFNRAWSPNYYSLGEVPDGEAKGVISRACAGWVLIVGVACLSLCLNEGLVDLLARESYRSAARFIPFVAMSYFFHGIYLMYAAPILEKKKTWIILSITVTVAGVNLLGNLLLVPRYGALGAVAATVGSGLLQAALAWWKSQSFRGHLMPGRLLWGAGLVVLVFGSYFGWVSERAWLRDGGVWLVGCLALLVLVRHRIPELLQWIRGRLA